MTGTATAMRGYLAGEIGKSRRLAEALLADDAVLAALERAARACVEAFRAGGKVLLAGNGGSAAQAQHLAAELVGRFAVEREGLPAMALTTDTSILTAVGNDYGFDQIFARQIRAHGRRGDVFIGLSTSGTSANVLRALEEARAVGVVGIGFTGSRGAAMREVCDVVVEVPSADAPRIQEGHLALGHALCAFVERECFGGSAGA